MVAYSGIDAKAQKLFDTYNVPQSVANAIKNAAAKTGVDFNYLVEKAATESGFKTGVQSKSSSATGLYQFIDSTWLAMIKKHGDDYGLDNFSDAIKQDSKGNYTVADKATRQEILNLRKDADIAAIMAAEFADDNKIYLENSVSGEIGNTDLYLAHFMGASGASRFLNAKSANGNQIAASLFPSAARANHNVFYDTSGKARTLDEVYAFFDKKFDGNGQVSETVETSTGTVDKVDNASAYEALVKTNPHVTHYTPSSLSDNGGTTNWRPMFERLSQVTGEEQDLSNEFARSGMLAPDTMMYMAALDTLGGTSRAPETNGGAGAKRWLFSDEEGKKDETQGRQWF